MAMHVGHVMDCGACLTMCTASGVLRLGCAARRQALIRAAADANMNFIRVWGGGGIEKQAFYDACDRHGIMVYVWVAPDDTVLLLWCWGPPRVDAAAALPHCRTAALPHCCVAAASLLQ